MSENTTTNEVIQGQDILFLLGEACIAMSTAHTLNITQETQERAVKPPLSEPISARSKFTHKTVTKTSVQLTADAVVAVNTEESGYIDIAQLALDGKPVACKGYVRKATAGGTAVAYLEGNFIITACNLTASRDGDATYSVTAENDGPVTITESSFTM